MHAPPTSHNFEDTMRAVLLLVRFLTVATITISFGLCCNGNLGKESEKQALLKFKQDLKDPAHRLLSWRAGEGDCCNWTGVVCDNSTGHVLELHLSRPLSQADHVWRSLPQVNTSLGGKINPSLLNLKHLNYLDLSHNDFEGIQIPTFFGSLKSLRYLDLTDSGFEGTIPHQLGNISSLRHLRLSSFFLKVENLEWISGLSQLEHLDMSYVNLSKASDWLQVTNMLPSLVELHLSECELDNIPSLLATNFTSLAILDLSANYFNSSMPKWVFSLRNLASLDLSYCGFQGPIPSSPHNFTSLRKIDLSWNHIGLPIPEWLFNHKDLTTLSLGNNQFGGPFPGGIVNMTGLKFLHLESNNFHSSIPKWLHSFKLIALDLSNNNFNGNVSEFFERPRQIESLSLVHNNFSGHLTEQIGKCKNLYSLDVSFNAISGPIPVSLGNLSFLGNLDISGNQFNGILPETIGKCKNLYSFDVSFNSISGPIPVSLGNLSSLGTLDISNNQFNETLPETIGQLKLLAFLDISYNSLEGILPETIGKCKNLYSLDVSFNSISGPIPVSLGNQSFLGTLDISNNQFNGTLPETIGQLKLLRELNISYNSLEGLVSEVHFAHLASLLSFSANANSLTLETRRGWILPFNLETLVLDYWHLGPEFPMWLQGLTKLSYLSLSNTGISATIPTWFWNISSHFRYINLSHNQLYGEIQNIVQGLMVDLSSNQFNGSLPLVSSAVRALDLSNSSFSGSVFHFFCDKIDTPKSLALLYLGNNLLGGNIPDCWINWQDLGVLNLENNNFTGKIPSSMESLTYFKSLNLRNNRLSGELPSSLMYSMNMLVLDLGENEFVGSLPAMKIADDRSSRLVVLNLRSNKLQGHIPQELCGLGKLQMLDLAHNNLSGTIPRCFNRFSAMAILSQPESSIELLYFYSGFKDEEYFGKTLVVTKGTERAYDKNLGLVTSIDLSVNAISGEIPEELTDLIGLQTLNLSENLLIGRIPSKIGNMGRLESVDLSMNRLHGEMPASMTRMTMLSRLNLSYNNLRGRIPESTQLQSLDPSGFVGNELCGPPLSKNCSASKVIPPTVEQHRGYELFEDGWLYLSLGLGFMFGFWSILGSLLLNMPWSAAFSRFQNTILLKLHAVIVEYF